ncbi:MAG: U32 family peptidase [Nanoarchaeota archaeon]|nr:U32 family peptidase [Nanoarchaeota archaeon]
MEMRYDLATNFDNELIERVADFGAVKSIYGKLASDVVGGGRPSIVLPKISRKQLRKHIETAHKHQIEFNYLLNASCTGNQEFISSSHKEFIKLIKQVQEDGADAVTVANPTMLGIVKEQFPDLNISASVYLNINNLSKLKHFENMGANQLTLHYSLNRDFELLENALKIANPETELRLIANNVCLHNCPYGIPGHSNLLSHSSQSKDKTKGFVIDIYTIMCSLQKIKNPAEFLMAEWIRPEDVHRYEELCNKAGNSNLVLKLTDRAKTTDWLVNVVKAYAKKSYDGNLLDIINYIGNKGGYAQIHKLPMVIGALTGKAKPSGLLKLEKATFLPEVYIDNKSLNGFLDPFIKNPCKDKTCYTKDKPYGECRHCYNLAEKLIKIDENKIREAIDFAEDLVHSINSGRMFGK